MLRLDKIKSTCHVISVEAYTALENGEFVTATKLNEDALYGFGEIFLTKAPASGKVVLVAGAELMADERLAVQDYKIAQGDIVRGIFLEKGDIFTIPARLITSIPATPAPETFVCVETGATKPKYKATLAGGELLATEILSTVVLAGETHVQLMVL